MKWKEMNTHIYEDVQSCATYIPGTRVKILKKKKKNREIFCQSTVSLMEFDKK